MLCPFGWDEVPLCGLSDVCHELGRGAFAPDKGVLFLALVYRLFPLCSHAISFRTLLNIYFHF